MAPASIRYGREIGVIMLVFIVGWAYCLVSPILIVVSAIYFMSSWVVWRWQIIYVYVRCASFTHDAFATNLLVQVVDVQAAALFAQTRAWRRCARMGLMRGHQPLPIHV